MIFFISIIAKLATTPAIALSTHAGTASELGTGGGKRVVGDEEVGRVAEVEVVRAAGDEDDGMVDEDEAGGRVAETTGAEDGRDDDGDRAIADGGSRALEFLPSAAPISSLKPNFNSSGTFSAPAPAPTPAVLPDSATPGLR